MRTFLLLFLVGCSSAKLIPNDAPDAGISSSSDASAKPQSCEYATQGFGTTPGTIVRSTLSWQGYAKGASTLSTIKATDLFDCDGSKGIRAIVFDVSAEWCPACIAEASDMHALYDQFDALGIEVITLMLQDASHAPASLDTIDRWKQKYDVSGISLCLDPQFSFQPPGSGSLNLPLTLIVDPRTMTIVKQKQGYLSAYPIKPDADAVALAKKNGG